MMAKEWFAVALGGMAGATLRHVITSCFSLVGAPWLPIATLTANSLGCFAIGLLAHWAIQSESQNEWWVVGARVGVLGGLTTFSSFALEVVRVWQTERVMAVVLCLSHLLVGICAVLLGMSVAKTMLFPAQLP